MAKEEEELGAEGGGVGGEPWAVVGVGVRAVEGPEPWGGGPRGYAGGEGGCHRRRVIEAVP